ncbi:MAG: [acyl-carrier-protein] S-malonyltransferase [Bdellovibrio sp.]|nr:MAG: [acyl-carrier-protein] S-malonyltransferase [Bdellovibrio sp.]
MPFAILFPGQGSQQPGMGKFLIDEFAEARLVFEEASDFLGFDIKRLCFEGSVEELALTENTQPCLLTVSIATWQVIKKRFNPTVEACAGHSVGEYGALVAAGVIPFYQAVLAVRTRGQAMQSAVPVGEGGMTALLGLNEEQAQELCRHVVKKSGFAPLSPANFNCPGQIVLSGSQKALQWLVNGVKAEDLWPESPPRMKLIPLSVSAPFHCELMKPAEDKMREVLNQIKFQATSFPVIQNLTAKAESQPENLRENLIQQVSRPVQWNRSMKTLQEMGLSKAIELGTGKVLQGLLKKIDSEFFHVFNTNSLDDLKTIEKACD